MRKILLTLLCCAVVTGCVGTPHDEVAEEKPNKGGVLLSVDGAHGYFDEHAEALALPELLSTKEGANGTRSAAVSDIVLTPDWAEASAYHVYEVDVVDVPLMSNVRQTIRRHDRQPGEASRLYEPGIETRMVMVGSEGETEVTMFLITMIPD